MKRQDVYSPGCAVLRAVFPEAGIRPATTMLFRRLAFRLLLSLLLVFAQQQAQLHMLGHGLEEIAHKVADGAAQDQSCEKCLSFAHLDDAPAPSTPVFAQPAATAERPRVASFVSFESLFRAAYLSRGPPLIA